MGKRGERGRGKEAVVVSGVNSGTNQKVGWGEGGSGLKLNPPAASVPVRVSRSCSTDSPQTIPPSSIAQLQGVESQAVSTARARVCVCVLVCVCERQRVRFILARA